MKFLNWSHFLSCHQALDLVRKTTVNGVCVYRNLCSRWTDTDHTDDIISAEGVCDLIQAQHFPKHARL